MIGRESKYVPPPPHRDARVSHEKPQRAQEEALPAPLAAEMGARFGVSFGDVRVRRDSSAEQEAKSLDAQAFAQGNEIAFAAGRYDPVSSAGRKLIAHELAHVVQQRRGGATAGIEARADRASEEAILGRAVDTNALGGAPAGIHTQPEEKKPAATPDVPGKGEDKTEEKEEAGGHTHSFTKSLDKFALNKDTLTAAHMAAIDELAFGISLHVGLLARGKARVEIVGHTDSSGTEEHNQKLGQDRADRVKEALEKKLAGEKGPTVDWSVRSAGESEPLIPTANNKHEPRNRRVEVRVTVVSLPEPKKPPEIKIFPEGPIMPEEPGIPKRPDDDLWERMEENRRKIEEYDRKHPRKPKSFQDVVVDGLMNSVIDPLIDKLPVSKSLRDKAREGIRDGIKAGTEKACEAAIDATGTTGDEAKALKEACKAAIKMKPGEKGSGGSP